MNSFESSFKGSEGESEKCNIKWREYCIVDEGLGMRLFVDAITSKLELELDDDDDEKSGNI